MGLSASLYGLGVRSDAPIAAFGELAPPPKVDVRWHLGAMPAGLAGIPADGWRAHGTVADDLASPVEVEFAPSAGLYRFRYADGTRVVVDAPAANVWATWPSASGIEDTATYLLGPVMGFVLRLRGVSCLHASAVALGDRALAFAGHAGAGKSTLAAAFALRGTPVLTEDVLALRPRGERTEAAPGYPLVRLWPSSVASLLGAPEALPRISPTWDKRFLSLGEGGAPFAAKPLTLGAIVFLRDRAPTPSIARLPPAEAIVWLVAHAYSARLLDRSMRAAEFECFARVAAQVPAYVAAPPARHAELPSFCDALVAMAAASPEREAHAPV